MPECLVAASGDELDSLLSSGLCLSGWQSLRGLDGDGWPGAAKRTQFRWRSGPRAGYFQSVLLPADGLLHNREQRPEHAPGPRFARLSTGARLRLGGTGPDPTIGQLVAG